MTKIDICMTFKTQNSILTLIEHKLFIRHLIKSIIKRQKNLKKNQGQIRPILTSTINGPKLDLVMIMITFHDFLPYYLLVKPINSRPPDTVQDKSYR